MLSQKGKLRFSLALGLLLLAAYSTNLRFKDDSIQGYIEGRLSYISSSQAGKLIDLHVDRGDIVKKDDELFILEDEPQNLIVKQAEKELKNANLDIQNKEDSLTLAQSTYERKQKLKDKMNESAQNVDEAKTSFEQAKHALEQAKTKAKALKNALEEAKWQLSQKDVKAPKSGKIFDTYYLVGERVPENKPILSILSDNDIHVLFFVPFDKLKGIKIGQEIQLIGNDALVDKDGEPLKAKITFINPQAEYTPPVIYSTQTNHKLIYRIEAKLKDNHPYLHPGLPVSIKIKS